MNMQDKEFDQIFNTKLEDFEVEPSAIVWDNIADGLDGKKSKQAMMPWLSIAATVLVVLGAGIFFLQKAKSPSDKPKENKLVASRVETPVTVTPKDATETMDIKPEDVIVSTVHHPRSVTTPIKNVAAPFNNKPEPAVQTTERAKTESPQLIAMVINPASTHVNTATVPDVPLTLKNLDATPQVEKPVMASAAAPVKKRGIHSMGGLINVLVAKVDKREDKLIEFSDSDDDENGTDLTGVNLGLIKIKKK
jgi:hypothetical protein